MTQETISLKALRDVADKTTPGPWAMEGHDDYVIVADAYPDKPIPMAATSNVAGIAEIGNHTEDCGEANGAHIATFDPPTVKRLLAIAEAALDINAMCNGDCSIERFDRVAEMFRRDTGMTRPGKDIAAASGEDTPREFRQAAFDKWWKQKFEKLEAALTGITE